MAAPSSQAFLDSQSPNRPRLSTAAQRLLGTAPTLTAAGRLVALGDDSPLPTRAEAVANLRGRFPQTTYYPLPGTGQLHPLDCIVIAGVTLPLAEPPEYSVELRVSERASAGSDWETLVSHGKSSSPVRIKLLLFRDASAGYEGGVPRGKDWFAEWDRIAWTLIPAKFDRRGAVPVSYPTLARRGCDSVIFTKDPVERHLRGGFWTVDLEGRNPRAVKFGGASKKVENLRDFGSRADPATQTVSNKNAVATTSQFYAAMVKSATQPPSNSRRGK